MFNKKIISNIAGLLKAGKWSIAVAESVTSGFLQAAFSTAEQASLFFQGGITTYNIGQKCRHLLVEPLHALECDSVSSKVAEDMSKQVCNMFTSTYGIGVTGYAAKMPEKNIDTLFAYYSIARQNTILESGKLCSDKEEGLQTQIEFVNQLLEKFNALLAKKKHV